MNSFPKLTRVSMFLVWLLGCLVIVWAIYPYIEDESAAPGSDIVAGVLLGLIWGWLVKVVARGCLRLAKLKTYH